MLTYGGGVSGRDLQARGANCSMHMTKLEMDLLELLQEDCRISLEKLAVMTGSTIEETAEAIDSMEKRHVILRYAPTINWDLTDRERVEAMIEVRVTPQRDMGFDAVAKRIYRFEEVKSVYLMSGSYDLLVLVEAPTLKQLALFVSQKLSTLEMVTGTATSFVLKRYKDHLQSSRRLRRLRLVPQRLRPQPPSRFRPR